VLLVIDHLQFVIGEILKRKNFVILS